MIPFGARLHRAFDLAAMAHDGQVRKDPGWPIPHVAHVCGVAFLLAGHGFGPVLTNPDPAEQAQRLRWLHEALAEGWDHPILSEYDATLTRLAREAAMAPRATR